MKNIFKTRLIALMTLSSVILVSSCLEDTGYLDIYNGLNSGPVVSFGQADHGRVVRTVEVNEAPQDVAVSVNIARASSDVTVTVSIDTEALDAYNEAELAKDEDYVPYSLLPDSVYTIPSATVTIPKGTLDGVFNISLTSSKIDLGEQYMLPLVITGVNKEGVVIASNLNTALVAIVVKNKYDGLYTVTGTMVDNVSASLVGYYPWEASLVTNGARQNVLQDEEGYFSDPRIHIIRSLPSSISGYGGFIVTFNFDANDNVISVINLLGQPNSANTRSAQLDPTGINKWDPATKTLKVKYFMIQTNQPTGTAPRVTFDETYTYKGPRP